MTLTSPQPQAPNVAFEFVRSLAGELSGGKIELPSFPEIAMRVRKVLSDSNASIEQVMRVVGSEPALAARLMRVSNAASFNRTGKPITDLRTAINRIGYSMLRSAAMAFALSQMRRGIKLDPLQARLNALWQHSTRVAALSCVLARSCTKVNPDEAMLTGMMQGIGKLYIMTRAAQHPQLFADGGALDEIMRDWHAAIGKAILENWEFAQSMCEAVGEQDDLTRDGEGEPDLRDVLAIAIVMASYGEDIAGLETAFRELPVARRLSLDEPRIRAVVKDCAAEVTALSEALGS
jgi:HD-like signal output (HDOD) protein